MAEEFFEGVHRRARVGVALGEAVPEGVGDDTLAREGDRLAGVVALWPVEALERLDPGAHLALEVRGPIALVPSGFFKGRTVRAARPACPGRRPGRVPAGR